MKKAIKNIIIKIITFFALVLFGFSLFGKYHYKNNEIKQSKIKEKFPVYSYHSGVRLMLILENGVTIEASTYEYANNNIGEYYSYMQDVQIEPIYALLFGSILAIIIWLFIFGYIPESLNPFY
jgi:hypothetical protein